MTAERGLFVSTDWLASQLGAPDLVVVEGSSYLPAMRRDPDAEFVAAHIPGAIRLDIDRVCDPRTSLPHMLPSEEEFAAAVGSLGIGDGMRIVVYDGVGLHSAPRVRWMFKAYGVADVTILDGGLPRWVGEGRATEKGPARPVSRKFTARLNRSAVADLAQMKRVLADGSAQVVDARPVERFSGEAPEPRSGVRSGHMPGSLNVPSTSVVANGSLLDAAALRQKFEQAGVALDRPIITTCGSGVTAATLSLALERIGAPAQALYDGSWSEWGSRNELPAATGREKR